MVSYFVSESNPCTPNPCLHGGVCNQAGNSFICDCSGTSYTDETCNTGLIFLPTIPTLIKNKSYSIEVSTNLSFGHRVAISLISNGMKLHPNIILQSHRKNDTLEFIPMEAGIHNLTHEHKSNDLFKIQPSELIVLVRDEMEPIHPNNYFKSMDLRLGYLSEGCCTPEDDMSLSCPGSTQQVVLKAACQWQNDKATQWAPGVIFADAYDLSLPVSIAGYNFSQDGKRSLPSVTSECTPCNPDEPVCMLSKDGCYCYNFTGSDTLDFLNTHALGLTFIERIQKLMPTWLELEVNISEPTNTYQVHDYLAPIVRVPPHSDIQAIQGCNRISPVIYGIYSVFRYNKRLSGKIDGQTYLYHGDSYTEGSSDPLCFAVNLCHGSDSPVFIQLPQPVQNILVSEHLKILDRRGWHIQLNTVTVSRSHVHHTSGHNHVWNGVEMTMPPAILTDISINTNIEVVFPSESLNIHFTFTGDASFQYQVGNVY